MLYINKSPLRFECGANMFQITTEEVYRLIDAQIDSSGVIDEDCYGLSISDQKIGHYEWNSVEDAEKERIKDS